MYSRQAFGLSSLGESRMPTHAALGLVQVGIFCLKSAPSVRKAKADPRRIGSAQAQPPIPRAFKSAAANDEPRMLTRRASLCASWSGLRPFASIPQVALGVNTMRIKVA